MADLNTITLSELATITELGENDKVLVESGGRMKKISGSLGGGGAVVIDLIYDEENYRFKIEYTTSEFADLLASGQVPIFHIDGDYEYYGTLVDFDISQNQLLINIQGSQKYFYYYDDCFEEYMD